MRPKHFIILGFLVHNREFVDKGSVDLPERVLPFTISLNNYGMFRL